MEVIYQPAACRPTTDESGAEVAPKFEGTVTITVPTFDQRYDYMEQCGFEADESGRVNTSELLKPRSIRKIVAMSQGHYKTVGLRRVADGKAYETFLDLAHDPECDPILMDVGIKILTGQIATLGNG